MGGTCAVQEEPGKQNPRSCRAQELARSRAHENARQKKERLIEVASNRAALKGEKSKCSQDNRERVNGALRTISRVRLATDLGINSFGYGVYRLV